jgi:hypothetical protein
LYPNEDVVFGILTASRFSIGRFLREGLGVKLRLTARHLFFNLAGIINRLSIPLCFHLPAESRRGDERTEGEGRKEGGRRTEGVKDGGRREGRRRKERK